MSNVLLLSVTVDQDVIQVSSAELIQMLSENVIDEVLSVWQGIDQLKGHDQVLIKAVMGAKHSFPFFSETYSESIVCGNDV